MIPADVLSRLRISADSVTQAASPAQKLSDVLSDLIPGQRVLAEIQALLPNGSYRALVAQREVVLSLPFAAKNGDTLELEVQESEGQRSLAYVGKLPLATQDAATELTPSFSSSLSRTGQLIADLLPRAGEGQSQPAPVPLNGSAPLLENAPTSAADIAPALKQAISQSGMFYESHQAQWVQGQLPTEVLYQEPQGRLSGPPPALPTSHPSSAPTSALEANPSQAAASPPSQGIETQKPLDTTPARLHAGDQPTRLGDERANLSQTSQTGNPEHTQRTNESGPVPRELAPLVQNQLEALATQHFVWQGQVWPGQNMEWDITPNPDRRGSLDGEVPQQWATQIRLNLPNLGDVEGRLRLNHLGELEVTLSAREEATRHALRLNAAELDQHFQAGGLKIIQFGVNRLDQAHETDAT